MSSTLASSSRNHITCSVLSFSCLHFPASIGMFLRQLRLHFECAYVAPLIMLRTSSWICTQDLLMMLGKPQMILGIKPCLSTYKANVLLSLQPQDFMVPCLPNLIFCFLVTGKTKNHFIYSLSQNHHQVPIYENHLIIFESICLFISRPGSLHLGYISTSDAH